MNEESSRTQRAVITGMGVCTPLGKDCASFALAVTRCESRIAPATAFDASMLNSDLVSQFEPDDRSFELDETSLARMDRGAWFAVKAFNEALAQSGLDLGRVDPERLAVVVGTSHSGIEHVEAIYRAFLAGRLADIGLDALLASGSDHPAGVLCAKVGAKGPKATISSACASSNTAVGYACDLIRDGAADVVLVAGTDTVSLSILSGFNCLRAVSKAPAAPFSNPSGISLGEGAGVVLIESHEHARRRGALPIAEVLGYGLSGDAYHETATDIEGRGVEAAIRAALDDAQIAAHEVDYVSAHGTGTDANDIPEAIATLRVLGARVPLSSPKSYLGHTLGASGIIELILTILFAQKDLIPHTANFSGPRPGCPEANYVPNAPQPGRVETFVCNNYGFGGNNSSLVLSLRPQAEPRAARPDREVVLTGMGLVTSAGGTADEFFARLWDGAAPPQKAVHTIGPIDLGAGLKRFARSSPMIKYAVSASGEAIRSGLNGDAHLLADEPYQNGLVGGVVQGAQRSVEKFMSSVFVDGPQYASATHFPMTTMNASAGQVSIAFGIKGFNTTFCGTPAAFKYAHDLVRRGRQDRVTTFGCDELTPCMTDILSTTGLLSAAPLAAFGDEAGVNLGEGAAALQLEAGKLARRRGAEIRATIAGVGLVQDGQASGIGADGDGLARAVQQAFAEARIGEEDVAAVVGIGVGTAQSKQAELKALAQVFGSRVPPVATTVDRAGYCAAATFYMHLALAAEILRRASLPYGWRWSDGAPRYSAAPIALDRPRYVLVVFTSIGADHTAVILRKEDRHV